jgi:hypothetical protein
MADLTVNSPDRAQNSVSAESAAAGGDAFLNTGKELLLITHTNGGGSQETLTIAMQKSIDGEDVPDKTVDIPAGEKHLLGPFPTGLYNDVDGKVQLTYSSETDLELLVIQP